MYLPINNQKRINISKKLSDKIQGKEWYIDMGLYKSENCHQFFTSLKEVRAQKIWLGYNSNPFIMYDILKINFPFLQELWISQNNIDSIEIIARMDLPVLEELWLRENFITEFKTLRKCFFKKLKTLGLYGNLSKSIDWLSQLSAPKLQCIWLQYESQQIGDHREQSIQGESIGGLAKIQSNTVQNICIGSSMRIKEDKIYNLLKSKMTVPLIIYTDSY